MDTDHGDSILSASVFAHFKTSPLDLSPSPVLPRWSFKIHSKIVLKNLIYHFWYSNKSENMKTSSEIYPLCLHPIRFC